MAKQKSGPTPPPSAVTVQNKDLLLRLSFMHQAAAFLHVAQPPQPRPSPPNYSHLTNAVASGSGTSHSVEGAPRRRHGKGRMSRSDRLDGEPASLARLARSIGEGINDIAVHNKAKLDPSFKRSICKACSTILLPGTTSRIRVKPSSTHAHLTQTTCLNCSLSRTIPAPPPPSPLTSVPPASAEAGPDPVQPGPAGQQRVKPETRGKTPLFSDRTGVGHIRMVGNEKEDI